MCRVEEKIAAAANVPCDVLTAAKKPVRHCHIFFNEYFLHNSILIMKCVNFSENRRNEFSIFVQSLRAADLLVFHQCRRPRSIPKYEKPNDTHRN